MFVKSVRVKLFKIKGGTVVEINLKPIFIKKNK
jgi:hypothetical protein